VIRAALVVAAALVLAGEARSDLRAEQISPATASELAIGGPDAIGGVGDWWLANDVVEVVIDDVSRAYGLLTHGGTIVDVGLRDRAGEDQFARLSPLVNLSQRVVVGYDAIRAEIDPAGRFARIVVTSPGLRAIERGGWWSRWLDPLVPESPAIAAVRVETVYEVRPGESFVRIATTLTNTGSEPASLFAFGDVWMRGGRGGRGFLGDSLLPARTRGFALRGMTANILDSLGALATFDHAGLLGVPGLPPIAYALLAPERSARGLPLFGTAGEHATLVFALIGDPPVEELGLGSLVRALFRRMEPGAVWAYERRLLVSGRRDVEGIRAALRGERDASEAEVLTGSVRLGGRRGSLSVETETGAPVTQLELVGPADAALKFRVPLFPGAFVAELRAEYARPQRVPFRIRAGEVAPVTFRDLPQPARLVFAAPAFADAGPGRVEIRGRDGTPDPVFGDDLLGATLDGAPLAGATATSSVVFLGNDRDPREVALAPGRYALTATRGLDWELASQTVEVSAEGERAAVKPFALRPLEPIPGFVIADLHVHGEASDDSQAPDEDRLRRFVAEGVDVIVATDHDHVADYRPAVARLDLAGRIRVVPGVEVTGSAPSDAAPWTIGHHNAWPIPYRADAHRHGAPPSQNRAVGALYEELRGAFGARVVQLNHPRPTPDQLAAGDTNDAFFAHLGEGRAFDPTLPIDAPENGALVRATGSEGTRALDFDALEVMNGDSYARYRAVRADWYALLRQGVRRTATANSDTHAPDKLAAYPRNYVYVGERGDDPERFDAALRAGRSFGTTGPRVRRFTANGAASGDLAAAPGGRTRVSWQVDAASWVPVDEVRVLRNGEVVHASPEREGSLDLALERDAFLTLEAGAPLDVDPEAWIADHPGPYTEVIAPGFVATAFSNPVFVDVDGNGRFDAPGLR